jgi:pyruvate dehydrogenase E2 component (dihydrolipoamide acetyltransferase)
MAATTWREPRDPVIFGSLDVDMTEGLAFVASCRGGGANVTVTHLVGRALALALDRSPNLNSRIVLGRVRPLPSIDIAFLVSLDEGDDLSAVKVERADEKSVQEIAGELASRALTLREGRDEDFSKAKGTMERLPWWALGPALRAMSWLSGGLGISIPALGVKADPFGSAIITSVGMFGVDTAFVPFTPFARVPLYLLIGAVKDRAVVVDGRIEARPVMTLTASIDHRYVDGHELAMLAHTLRDTIEDPWRLPEAAELDADRDAG